ncbi:MAG: hypothetical protein AAGA77_09770 [Bacteroidota bacterium]
MAIQKFNDLLENSEDPVERIIHENRCMKVSLIGFGSGMMLREKKVTNPTKLTVLSGSVKYFEADRKILLTQYDEFEIPVDVRHYILADEQSICLLTQDRLNQNN